VRDTGGKSSHRLFLFLPGRNRINASNELPTEQPDSLNGFKNIAGASVGSTIVARYYRQIEIASKYKGIPATKDSRQFTVSIVAAVT